MKQNGDRVKRKSDFKPHIQQGSAFSMKMGQGFIKPQATKDMMVGGVTVKMVHPPRDMMELLDEDLWCTADERHPNRTLNQQVQTPVLHKGIPTVETEENRESTPSFLLRLYLRFKLFNSWRTRTFTLCLHMHF